MSIAISQGGLGGGGSNEGSCLAGDSYCVLEKCMERRKVKVMVKDS